MTAWNIAIAASAAAACTACSPATVKDIPATKGQIASSVDGKPIASARGFVKPSGQSTGRWIDANAAGFFSIPEAHHTTMDFFLLERVNTFAHTCLQVVAPRYNAVEFCYDEHGSVVEHGNNVHGYVARDGVVVLNVRTEPNFP